MKESLSNLNIESFNEVAAPRQVRTKLDLTELSSQTVLKARHELIEILAGRDNRKLIICGPCSIHDPKSALEYAERLVELKERFSDKFLIIMRAYFEKPRTTVGWKGYINDPLLNNSFRMDLGLERSREILLKITELGMPVATEFLDPITPQYLSDLVSWVAIGARTTESQTHREMASGLSAPVGFKNSTAGDFQIAINAMKSTASPHRFLGVDSDGKISMISTKGNPNCHIILRGGKDGPNYDRGSVVKVDELLKSQGLNANVVVDCSHDNSNKDHSKQGQVLEYCIDQINSGLNCLTGFMLESHLNEGNQKITSVEDLSYGVSITDKCINWQTTESLLTEAYNSLVL